MLQPRIQAKTLLQTPLVEMTGGSVAPPGIATRMFADYLLGVDRAIPTYQPLVLTDPIFGGGSGVDSTIALQRAIDTAVEMGGATIIIPSGTFLVSRVVIPAGTVPISIVGQGPASILQRQGDLQQGQGMIDVFGSNVTLENFAIEGRVLSATGLYYNVDFMTEHGNDPMAPTLTRNTSVWVHGPCSNFSFRRMVVKHTGGYALLLDAGSGGMDHVEVVFSIFRNNRPHMFGVQGGEAIYGSWTGGVYVNGDGRSSEPGKVLKSLVAAFNTFDRNTGNCLWSHLYGLDELHEDFRFYSNFFRDCGLDGILVGGVTGGAMVGNVFRRIGYVAETDDTPAAPRWLVNLQATALDSSGLVKGVPYANNSFTSVNGGCMDLDGHGDSAITGNVCRTPYPGEPEYDEDQIAITGPTNSGPSSYGVNLGNTNDTPWGGANVQISGNTFLNLHAGAVRLYGARDCQVESNNIIVPDQPVMPPIAYGPLGASIFRRPRNNVIRHNRVKYSPAMSAPVVFEDPQYAAFTADEVNYVFGNLLIGNGNATEFAKNVNSGSPTYASTVWFP
jgi:hypothetical protein